MAKYRTREQFNNIMWTARNGNWSDAAKMCMKHGFYADDLSRMYEDSGWPPKYQRFIPLLAEMAATLRASRP